LEAENLQKILNLIESRYLNTRDEKNLLGVEDFKSGDHDLLTADSLLTLAIDALCGHVEGESCPVSESHAQVFITKYSFTMFYVQNYVPYLVFIMRHGTYFLFFI
jgi:hypothetical protein